MDEGIFLKPTPSQIVAFEMWPPAIALSSLKFASCLVCTQKFLSHNTLQNLCGHVVATTFFWDTQEHVIEVKRVKTLNAQCSHVLISSNLLSVGLGHDGYQGLGFLSQTVSYLRAPSHNDFHIPLH